MLLAALAMLAICCHAVAQPPGAKDDPGPRMRIATYLAPPLVGGTRAQPTGPFIDFLRLIEARAAVRFEVIVVGSAREASAALERGDADAAGPVARVAESDPHLQFTEPLARLPVAILGRRDAARRGATLADLAGHRVAVVADGYIAATLGREQPGAFYVRMATPEEALAGVALAEVDYAVLDLAQTTWFASQMGLSGLSVAGRAPFFYEPALGMRRAMRPDRSAMLTTAVASVPASERTRLMRDWMAPAQRPSSWHDGSERAIAVAGAALLAALAALAAYRHRLQRQAALHDAIAGNVNDIITVRTGDRRRSYLYASPSLVRLTGYSLQDLTSRPIESFLHPDELDALNAYRERVRGGDESATFVHRFRKKDGDWAWLETRAKLYRRRNGDIDRVVSISNDITERRRIEERIRQLAFEDPVTGLPNRAALAQRLQDAIARSHGTGRAVAACFLDVDGFRQVNDARGHRTGDAVLRALAARLSGADAPARFVARLGSDEFVVLIEHVLSDAEAATTATRISELFRDPLRGGEESIYLTASIGIALYPQDAASAEDLLAAAETAMHAARIAGRNTWRRFDGEMGQRRQQKADALHRLRQAYEQGRLMLHYQPKIDLVSGRCTGVEALLRVSDGDRVHGPAGLIEAAEESGFITTLGQWVIETAAAQSRAWRKRGVRMRIAVNVSTRQLQDPRFVAWMGALVAADPQLPGCLDLEITESALASDASAANEALAALQKMGFLLCVDDFGTGYSSLAYLSKMPVQALKIDCSFVAGLPHGHGAREIVRAVIALAQSMQLTVIAEGVETAEQAEFLRDLDCGQAQGYLFARPGPAEQAAAFAAGSPSATTSGAAIPAALRRASIQPDR